MDYSILPGNYDYSLMIEHERLKGILLNQALPYSNFHYLSGSLAKGYDNGELMVERKDVKEQLTVRADFYIGAEGRNSITRKEMNSKIKKIEYNHQFLTVTFPDPNLWRKEKSFLEMSGSSDYFRCRMRKCDLFT